MIKVQYFNLEEKSYYDHPSKTIQLVHVRNRRQFSSASAFSFAARTNLVNNTKVEGTRTRLCLGRLRNCLSRRAGEKRISKKKKMHARREAQEAWISSPSNIAVSKVQLILDVKWLWVFLLDLLLFFFNW